MLSYSLCTICTSSKKLPVSIQTSFLALSSLNPSLTHPPPPPKKKKKSIKFSSLLCIIIQGTYIYCVMRCKIKIHLPSLVALHDSDWQG